MEVKKMFAIEKNCLLDRIVDKVQTSKNNQNRKAKKKKAANIKP
jgi:hypothetical protein